MGECRPALPHTPPTFLLAKSILLIYSPLSVRACLHGVPDEDIMMTRAELDRVFNNTAMKKRCTFISSSGCIVY